MTTNLRDLALRPRAVALLVALRKGPRSTRALADALADRLLADTTDLLTLMSTGIEGDGHGVRLVAPCETRSWGLTIDGHGWLESQGMTIGPDARQALYASSDAPAPCSNPSCSHVDDPAHPAGHICPQPAAARAVSS